MGCVYLHLLVFSLVDDTHLLLFIPLVLFHLIVAFDSHKYRNEERRLVETGSHERMMSFKKVLDDQMLEVQEGRDNDARGKEEERVMMLAQVEENRRYKQEEMGIIHKRKDEQM